MPKHTPVLVFSLGLSIILAASCEHEVQEPIASDSVVARESIN